VRFHYLSGPDARIDVDDRGLAYGDGLFETMAIRGGTIRRLDLHLQRLERGGDRLRLPLPERRELAIRIDAEIAGISEGLLKLVITRGPGPRGYAPPAAPEPVVILTATPQLPPRQLELRAVMLAQRLGENEKMAGIKHLCRLEQVLAQLELAQYDADEGILLSTSGHIVGGTSRNLFAVYGQSIVTPRVSRAGIAGVMRRCVLEQCERLGIAAEEADLAPGDLVAADELFMTNALVGIQSVAQLDGRVYGSRARATQLRAAIEAIEHV
jgi:4-amino-4-deoxychorismate lyase